MLDLARVRVEVSSLQKDAFLRAYPCPVFLIRAPVKGITLGAGAPAESEWLSKTYQADTDDLLRAPPSADPTRLARIERGPDSANPFANMITLGRVSTSDIALNFAAVSKVHAVILTQPGEWFLKDQSSTHGTWVGGERLEGDSKRQLHDGCEVRLGPNVIMTFKLPESLWTFFHGPDWAGGW